MGSTVRYLIVGAGRSGSSLLAAILSNAGANFDMPSNTSWDPRAGAYEHPDLLAAQAWQSRAEKISESLWPDRFGRRFCERRMRQKLSHLFTAVEFAKSSALVWLVHHIYKLGFQPKIIVSYRNFEDYIASFYLRGKPFSRCEHTYRNSYSTALLQLSIFGGCTISYSELTDKRETEWASAIEKLTSLKSNDLLRVRDDLVKQGTDRDRPKFEKSLVDPRVYRIEEKLQEIKGQVIDSDYFGHS